MTKLEFTNGLIGHLVWPLLVLVAILMFRQNLRELIDRLKSAKTPFGEYDFNESVKKFDTAPEVAARAEAALTGTMSAPMGLPGAGPGGETWEAARRNLVAAVTDRNPPVQQIYRGYKDLTHLLVSGLPREELDVFTTAEPMHEASRVAEHLANQGKITMDDLIRTVALEEMANSALEHPETITQERADQFRSRAFTASAALRRAIHDVLGSS